MLIAVTLSRQTSNHTQDNKNNLSPHPPHSLSTSDGSDNTFEETKSLDHYHTLLHVAVKVAYLNSDPSLTFLMRQSFPDTLMRQNLNWPFPNTFHGTIFPKHFWWDKIIDWPFLLTGARLEAALESLLTKCEQKVDIFSKKKVISFLFVESIKCLTCWGVPDHSWVVGLMASQSGQELWVQKN